MPVRIISFLDFGQELSHWSGSESIYSLHFAWQVMALEGGEADGRVQISW